MTASAAPTRFASLRPLRHRQFALVWWSALVSNIGTWMQTIAVGTLVTELTGKASGAGYVAAAAFLPIGIFSPIGGALADRVDRRRFLLLTTVAQALVAALLAVVHATGSSTPITVALIMFAEGAVAALGFPCYQAMLPDLVDRDELLGAVSLSAAQFNFGRVIGPALAGLVISLGSYTWAFVVNAASFGAVVLALLAVRVPPPPGTGDMSLVRRVADGFRAARAEPGCWTALSMAFVMALFASPFIALIPAIAVVLFDGDASTTSVLVAAQGVGAVAGALALASLAERFGRRRMLVLNLFLLPAALVVYASAPTLAAAAVALVLVGATYISVFSGMNVVVQLRAPTEYRGRILSLYFVVVGVVYPIGAALQGRVADDVGLRATTAGGAVAMAVVIGLVALLRPDRLGLLDDLPGRVMDGTVTADDP